MVLFADSGYKLRNEARVTNVVLSREKSIKGSIVGVVNRKRTRSTPDPTLSPYLTFKDVQNSMIERTHKGWMNRGTNRNKRSAARLYRWWSNELGRGSWVCPNE